MGRLLLLALIIVAVVLLWKAFGPGSWQSNQQNKIDSNRRNQLPKGPDDDEEFLWNIEKNRFKRRRAQEAAMREEEERIKNARERYRESTPEFDAKDSSEDNSANQENPEDETQDDKKTS